MSPIADQHPVRPTFEEPTYCVYLFLVPNLHEIFATVINKTSVNFIITTYMFSFFSYHETIGDTDK